MTILVMSPARKLLIVSVLHPHRDAWKPRASSVATMSTGLPEMLHPGAALERGRGAGTETKTVSPL
jgi:hypothetical protein